MAWLGADRKALRTEKRLSNAKLSLKSGWQPPSKKSKQFGHTNSFENFVKDRESDQQRKYDKVAELQKEEEPDWIWQFNQKQLREVNQEDARKEQQAYWQEEPTAKQLRYSSMVRGDEVKPTISMDTFNDERIQTSYETILNDSGNKVTVWWQTSMGNPYYGDKGKDSHTLWANKTVERNFPVFQDHRVCVKWRVKGESKEDMFTCVLTTSPPNAHEHCTHAVSRIIEEGWSVSWTGQTHLEVSKTQFDGPVISLDRSLATGAGPIILQAPTKPPPPPAEFTDQLPAKVDRLQEKKERKVKAGPGLTKAQKSVMYLQDVMEKERKKALYMQEMLSSYNGEDYEMTAEEKERLLAEETSKIEKLERIVQKWEMRVQWDEEDKKRSFQKKIRPRPRPKLLASEQNDNSKEYFIWSLFSAAAFIMTVNFFTKLCGFQRQREAQQEALMHA